MENLTPAQLALIGLAAAVLTQAIKLIFVWLKKEPNRTVITIVAFAASLALAYAFIKPTIGPIEDPMQFASYLFNEMGAVLGLATFIYNVLLDKLLEKLGLTRTAIAERRALSDNPI